MFERSSKSRALRAAAECLMWFHGSLDEQRDGPVAGMQRSWLRVPVMYQFKSFTDSFDTGNCVDVMFERSPKNSRALRAAAECLMWFHGSVDEQRDGPYAGTQHLLLRIPVMYQFKSCCTDPYDTG